MHCAQPDRSTKLIQPTAVTVPRVAVLLQQIQKMPVRRLAQTIKLKPEYVEEYIKIHAAVWPSVLERIAKCNIHDYSIFYDEKSGILFASFKYTGDNYEADMQQMKDDPETLRWWEVTDKMQESQDGGKSSKEGQWWRELKEVFYVQ